MMEHLVTVTVPAETTALVTLDRVKAELGITTTEHDALLAAKIAEASADIEAHVGYRLARETVTETFWDMDWSTAYVLLDRTPVASIAGVILDGWGQETSAWRLNPETGALYALTGSGTPWHWIASNSLVVAYSGGYLLPGQTGRDLPAPLEGAAADLVGMFWQSRGRDPSLRAETVDGVGRLEYWVGTVGREGSLPPLVMQKIAPFVRPRIA
ncbi:MAG: phage head-tail connector protein [Bauldia sp.]|nr:phage head-tail connector protein [Bauldia sp.]